MKHNLPIVGGLVLVAMALPLGLRAQTALSKDTTVNRTVVVEQEYNPDIMDASKVSVLPKVEPPTVSKKVVEYATAFFPATSIPFHWMNPYVGVETQPGSRPGYARVGYGTYGNLDVLGNYGFRLSPKDRLNVRLQADGMDGKLSLPNEEEKWKAHYYRTQAGIDYVHQFAKMDLSIGGNFGLSSFNYLPQSINNKQKFTSGDIHAGLTFTDETAPLQFSAETGLLLYGRQNNLKNADLSTSLQETIWRLKGNVSGKIDDQQGIFLALTLNNFWYGGRTTHVETGDTYVKNYTALNLNPYYELNGDDWKLHVGAHLDLSFGFDKACRMSPDIKTQYSFSDSYAVYANITGGKQYNDFRQLETLCPYGELPVAEGATAEAKPVFGYTRRPYDTYEQMNGMLGFKASPCPGLWLNVFGGYQNLKNDLSYYGAEMPTEAGNRPLLTFIQGNTDNAYAGGEISYDYKEIVTLSAKYTYRSWNAKAEQEALLVTKPQSELNFDVRVTPVPALTLRLGYDYMSRKKIKTYDEMGTISNLHLGASYRVFKNVSIYTRFNNLLNQTYSYYLGYPTEGFNFLGGLSFQF